MPRDQTPALYFLVCRALWRANVTKSLSSTSKAVEIWRTLPKQHKYLTSIVKILPAGGKNPSDDMDA